MKRAFAAAIAAGALLSAGCSTAHEDAPAASWVTSSGVDGTSTYSLAPGTVADTEAATTTPRSAAYAVLCQSLTNYGGLQRGASAAEVQAYLDKWRSEEPEDWQISAAEVAERERAATDWAAGRC